jgi:hypothetical protein
MIVATSIALVLPTFAYASKAEDQRMRRGHRHALAAVYRSRLRRKAVESAAGCRIRQPA